MYSRALHLRTHRTMEYSPSVPDLSTSSMILQPCCAYLPSGSARSVSWPRTGVGTVHGLKLPAIGHATSSSSNGSSGPPSERVFIPVLVPVLLRVPPGSHHASPTRWRYRSPCSQLGQVGLESPQPHGAVSNLCGCPSLVNLKRNNAHQVFTDSHRM